MRGWAHHARPLRAYGQVNGGLLWPLHDPGKLTHMIGWGTARTTRPDCIGPSLEMADLWLELSAHESDLLWEGEDNLDRWHTLSLQGLLTGIRAPPLGSRLIHYPAHEQGTLCTAPGSRILLIRPGNCEKALPWVIGPPTSRSAILA